MTTERRRRPPGRGFTLIETVVALLIVALGMTAAYMQLNQATGNSIYLREKTLASWIGSNFVTQYSLAPEWPVIGRQEEQLEYAGLEWHLFIEVAETDVDSLRRIDVAVALEDRPERIIHTVSGLIEQPVAGNFPPVNWTLAGQGQGG